jgi:hypothetical protein
MFENIGALGGSAAAPRLEPLEDRTTPAVVGTNGGTLDPVAVAQAGPIDQAFLAESARLNLLEAWLGAVASAQGSSPQVRQFGAQLSSQQIGFFNEALSALQAAGQTVQFTQFDLQLFGSFTSLTPGQVDSQFMALATLYTLQSATLAQAETVLGSSPAIRTFAQEQLFAGQQELLVEANILGSTNTLGMANLFGLLGSFDSIGVSGLSARGTTAGAFGTGGSGVNNGFGPATTAGTGANGGFGPGAGVGTNNGFGPGSSFGTTNPMGPGL